MTKPIRAELACKYKLECFECPAKLHTDDMEELKWFADHHKHGHTKEDSERFREWKARRQESMKHFEALVEFSMTAKLQLLADSLGDAHRKVGDAVKGVDIEVLDQTVSDWKHPEITFIDMYETDGPVIDAGEIGRSDFDYEVPD
jgi:hypothetical protein